MKKANRNIPVTEFDGCQLPCLVKLAAVPSNYPSASYYLAFKRFLSVPWNYYVKKGMKNIYNYFSGFKGTTSSQAAAKTFRPEVEFKKGDSVRIRSIEEIKSTLDPFGELKGCSFLHDMYQYCNSEQRIFKTMQYFLDERDYKRKKTRGLVLLENIYCNGTPVFGPCDRSCFLFWREEWLEKLN